MKIQDTKYQIRNTKKALTGGVAMAEAMRQINPDVVAVYPITPQTPIIETFSQFQSDGKVATELIQAESEHSAMSACMGAQASGARTMTATSSQGLALMNEMLYIASGLRLPIVMAVSARALAAPINIHGDHSDVMGTRDAGWLQIFSENVQEAYDNVFIALKLAEKVSLPAMAVMDGFNTSHSVENMEGLSDEVVKKFVGEFKPKEYLLDVKNPITVGAFALQNSYFEFKVEQEKAMREAKDEYLKIAKEFEKISGRKKDFFEEYETQDAERVLVLMGSVSGTAKEMVDKLRERGEKVGLLKINLFRPFPAEEIAKVLKKAKKIAVLDRSQSIGTMPPLYMEIKNALNGKQKIVSYIYGLGGRDIFQKDMEKVFIDLKNEKNSEGINYINL